MSALTPNNFLCTFMTCNNECRLKNGDIGYLLFAKSEKENPMPLTSLPQRNGSRRMTCTN